MFDTLFGGSRGGGKSAGLLIKFIRHQEQYGPNAKGLLIRRFKNEFEDMVVKAQLAFGAEGATYHVSTSTFTFPSGATIKFAHLENEADSNLYQGWERTLVMVDEIQHWADPGPIDRLKAILRSPAGVPCQFIATGNPGGVGNHWIRERYIDPAPLGWTLLPQFWIDRYTGRKIDRSRVYIPSGVKDNKFLDAGEYEASLAEISNPALLRAWMDGDWSAVAGQMFSEWSPRRHIIRPFQIPDFWVRFRGFDHGSAAPFGVLWMAVVNDDHFLVQDDGRRILLRRGTLVCHREWYGASKRGVGLKMVSEDIAWGILARDGSDKIIYSVADPAIFAHTDGPSIAERMAKIGVVWTPADNKRTTRDGRVGGWDMLRQRLQGHDDASPGLVVFDTCPELIRCIPSMQHDVADPEDVADGGDDHLVDVCRYMCMSRPFYRKGKGLPVYENEPHAAPGYEGHALPAMKVNLDVLFKANERQSRHVPLSHRRI